MCLDVQVRRDHCARTKSVREALEFVASCRLVLERSQVYERTELDWCLRRSGGGGVRGGAQCLLYNNFILAAQLHAQAKSLRMHNMYIV